MYTENDNGSFEDDIDGRSSVGVTACDPSREGTPVVYANDRFLEVTGYDREDVLGQSWLAMRGPETREERVARVRQAIEAGEATALDLRLYRADGDPFRDRVRLTPVPDDTGEMIRYVAFHEDVTEERRRRETVETLHEAATRVQDAETAETVCQRTVSAAATVLDFDMCAILLREDEFDPAKDIYLSGISVPVGDRGVFQAVGTETHAFDEGDVELAELLVTHTASALERIDRERELQRQNERLESFVNVVSHDLRNPLNVLGGSLELAQQTGDPEHFERGKRAHERMEELVEDLLALARQGEEIERLATVDVGRVADESWDTVATAEGRLDVETDLTVRCHEGRLRQLFENLFRNATEHGGENVTVTVDKLPSEDGFYVADDGPGIPPDRRDRVFESGFSTVEDGTGFGLSIVDQIATAHDWNVRVAESDAGGARFEIVDVDVVA
ncbi:histidine kinase [Halobacteriales archaeon QH_8_68_33]|nr:MAG: histidine kinase [Halobacteriales archaeon QH_8_68_33]